MPSRFIRILRKTLNKKDGLGKNTHFFTNKAYRGNIHDSLEVYLPLDFGSSLAEVDGDAQGGRQSWSPLIQAGSVDRTS